MSDEEKKPPKPTAKTSTVPLKKETVRITLRAKPGTGTGAQPTAPGAKTPPPPAAAAPPSAPSAPGAPSKPPAPAAPKAPGAPPAPAGGAPAAPPAPGAPSAPKPPTAAPTSPIAPGSKTVPLRPATTPTAPGGATPKAQPTAKLATGGPGTAPPAGPGTKPLPKATMQLSPTQPMAARPTASVGSVTAATPAPSQLIDDDEEEGSGLMPFAIAALILGLAVLGVELISSQKYLPDMLPEQENPYHVETSTGGWSDRSFIPEIPKE